MAARILLVLGLILGCQIGGCAKDAGEAKTTTTASAGDDGSGSVTSAADGSASEAPTGSGDASTASTSSTSDGGHSTAPSCDSSLSCGDGMDLPNECDNFAQDCPDGQKCIPYSPSGRDNVTDLKCVDVTGVDEPGDPCTSFEVYNDSCAEGAMCWGLDAQGNGHCVALCGGSPDAPVCEDTAFCTVNHNSLINLCLPGCNPLLQDCLIDPSDGCYALEEEFVCGPDASGRVGQVNDPCEYINECAKGLQCADAAFVGMGCGAATRCCTLFCGFPDGVCPNPDQACVQWLDPMGLPPNDPLLDVGACGVPM